MIGAFDHAVTNIFSIEFSMRIDAIILCLNTLILLLKGFTQYCTYHR